MSLIICIIKLVYMIASFFNYIVWTVNVKHDDPNIEFRLVSVYLLGGKICAAIHTIYSSLMCLKDAQPKHFIQPHYQLLKWSVNMHHYNYWNEINNTNIIKQTL